MRDCRAPERRSPRARNAVPFVVLALWIASVPLAGAEGAGASGTLIANGETVELPFVYVWAEKEGFYDPADPTWTILFVEHEIEERDLDDPFRKSAFVEVGVTETAEFGDEPELQVYSQSLKLSADAGGNISGGTYPELEVESFGPERFAGRVFIAEDQEFFEDTYRYDLTFDAPLSDPNAPIGDPLPADGGEPGRAYVAWVEAIHSGDLDRLASLLPPEMAAQLEMEGAEEELELMKVMTPTEVTVLGGSSDGETAILQVEAVMDGEEMTGEITLTLMGGFWVTTGESWSVGS